MPCGQIHLNDAIKSPAHCLHHPLHKLCGEQFALAKSNLDMNVRCAPCVSHRPQGAKAVAAIRACGDAAKALKALISLAAVAGVVVVAVVVALPDFYLRACNRFACQVADVALDPGALAFGVVLIAVAQQVKVRICGDCNWVKRTFCLRGCNAHGRYGLRGLCEYSQPHGGCDDQCCCEGSAL